MERDERSFRVALVADGYVNPAPDGVDGIAAASATGWGVLQLPAEDYPAEVGRRLLAEVAEQAEEFGRHGYDLVLVGQRDGLREALARVSLAVPDGIVPSSTAELMGFLSGRPSPSTAFPAGPGSSPGPAS